MCISFILSSPEASNNTWIFDLPHFFSFSLLILIIFLHFLLLLPLFQHPSFIFLLFLFLLILPNYFLPTSLPLIPPPSALTPEEKLKTVLYPPLTPDTPTQNRQFLFVSQRATSPLLPPIPTPPPPLTSGLARARSPASRWPPV